MKKYEILYIASNKLSEQELTALSEHIKKLIEGLEGKIIKEDIWGVQEMAYPIKKELNGHYILLTFEFDGQKFDELNKALNLTEGILRFIVSEAIERSEPKTQREPQIELKTDAPTEAERKVEAETKGEKPDQDELDAKLDQIFSDEEIVK